MIDRQRIGIAMICIAGAVGSAVLAQTPDADIQSTLISGVQQYERGELDAARATFESVLEQDADNATAIYELALTHYRQGESERALEILDDAFARDLAGSAEFYSLAASIADDLGRPDDALARFEEGVAAYPDDHGLNLNFGVTQLRLGQTAEARATFERAIGLQFEHPSAHYYLGRIYAAEGQTAAAILALGVSLGFDNNRQRMESSAGIIKELMESTVQVLDSGQTLAVVDVESGLPLDSMSRLSTRIPLLYASLLTAQRKSGGDTSYEPYAMTFVALLSTFIEADIDPASHFAADQYSRFFGPIVENGHQAAFAHMILAPLNPEAAGAWLRANGETFEAFREWTRSPEAQ